MLAAISLTTLKALGQLLRLLLARMVAKLTHIFTSKESCDLTQRRIQRSQQLHQ